MIAVAASLLPGLALLLYAMDHAEDWLRGGPAARHARKRRLRLVHTTNRPRERAERAPQHFDAA